MWLAGEAPGVWVGPRRMWAPGADPTALSACAPDRGCAPVVERADCVVPECPGDGQILVVEHDLANVGALPRDYGGYTAEIEALRADTRLAALHGNLRDHPEHSQREEARRRAEEAQRMEEQRHAESVRWVSQYRFRDRLEFSLAASIATLAQNGGSFGGSTATLALVFLQNADDADEESDETIFNILFGDTLGAELRVHFLYRLDRGQEAEWITAVGLGGFLSNRFATSVMRMPSFFGVFAPELGLILRADRSPTWYVAWGAPFSFLVSHDVAIDITPRLMLVDDWIPKPEGASDDPWEIVFMGNVGVRLP